MRPVSAMSRTTGSRANPLGGDRGGVLCWAAELGGCCDKVSREHLVSKGLWISDYVDVQGFPWCRNGAKRIGLGSFTAKHLCADHNNQLSDVDAAGRDAFVAFRESMKLLNQRRKKRPPPQRWRVRLFRLSGVLLERWFLKTTINLACVQGSELRWVGGNQLDHPPREIVELAFGARSFKPPMGLYGASIRGERQTSTDSLAFSPLIQVGSELVGGLFTFRGPRFLLYVGDRDLPGRFDLPGTSMRGWQSSDLRYHPDRYRWAIRESGPLSHMLEILWSDDGSDATLSR